MNMTDQMNTPVEIDTAIYEQMIKVDKAQRMLVIYERRLKSAFRGDEEKFAAALETFNRESAEDKRLQALYTGWPRYWHVSNNGHIHTSQSCSSCFPDTHYAWRIDLSGLAPEQVVEREAHNACSVCMPIAPAEQREARKRYTAEQKAQRQAEKDAKAAEKLRKAAQRAQKLVAKVDAWYEANGGREAVSQWPRTGSQSVYVRTWDLPSNVQNVIADDMEDDHGHRRWRTTQDPRKIIEQAKDQGLI